MIDSNEKVRKLRALMKENGLDAYYISGKDPHLGEYSPHSWRIREFISSFTGSNGEILVTEKNAVLWTDSRYFIQAENELAGTPFSLLRENTDDPDLVSYIKEKLPEGARIGFSEESVSLSFYDELLKKLENYVLVPGKELVFSIWKDRPVLPDNPVYSLSLDIVGESEEDKINRIREKLKEDGVYWTLIADLDDIAWCTNLRSSDIPYDPVFMSYLFISLEDVVLFIKKDRIDFPFPFRIEDEDRLKDLVPVLSKGRKGALNPKKINLFISSMFRKEEIILLKEDYPTLFKARKNAIELEGMRRAHLLDAISYLNFLGKLERHGARDELEVLYMLEEERKKHKEYLYPSFGGISAFGENGAIVHYAPDRNNYKKIDGSGLLVLDTGGQYESGTTDITRTLLFGKASEKEKRDYTLVLKGHLALAAQRFPERTRGYQLDVLAKQFMWNAGLNFFHGTGHGVGMHLNVHEGPMRISPAAIDIPLEKGMVISDEPGLYRKGMYGIRIENLVAVKEDVTTEFSSFLSFEILTLVPYERRLIDMRYITALEKDMIDKYHQWIRSELEGKLSEEGEEYLVFATSPL